MNEARKGTRENQKKRKSIHNPSQERERNSAVPNLNISCTEYLLCYLAQ